MVVLGVNKEKIMAETNDTQVKSFMYPNEDKYYNEWANDRDSNALYPTWLRENYPEEAKRRAEASTFPAINYAELNKVRESDVKPTFPTFEDYQNFLTKTYGSLAAPAPVATEVPAAAATEVPAAALAPALVLSNNTNNSGMMSSLNERPLTIDPRYDAPALSAPAASAEPTSVMGMFPEVEAMQRALYQQKQNEAMQAQAMQFARLTPFEKASYGLAMGGQQLGGAIGSALGGKDPQLQMISMRNSLMSQLDQNNPETFFKAARMAYQYGDSDFATKIADAGQRLQVSSATTRKTIAEAQKFELSNIQEQKLREELSKLPATATEADILGIVSKYGSPDKVLAVLQSSADKEAQRTARADQARKDNEAKLERLQERIDAEAVAAKQRGADAKQLEQMRINGRKEIEQAKNEFKQSQLENKSLPPSLIKEEGKDLELIDNLEAQITTLSPVINNLKIDPITKKAPLELGFVNNREYELANATGNSTTESAAYANLERAVQAATNLKVSAEKGVQTDKDVLRFANEFLAAFGKNDTRITFEALDNFVKATETARKKTEIRINKRREAAGVKPFFENTLSDQDLFDKYK